MFLLIWRYEVNRENHHAFAEAYGDGGVWARLFATGQGYIRTELLQDPKTPDLFVTLDFWQSRGAFSEFQTKHAAAYRDIDASCDRLTEAETFVGGFELASHDAGAFYPATA